MAETASIVYSAFPFIAAIVLLAVIIAHVVMVWKREKHVYPGDILWPLPFVVALLFVGCFCLKGWVLFEVGPIELCLFSVAMCVFGATTQIRRYFLTSLASLPRFTGWGVRALIACVAIAFVSVVSAHMIDFIWFGESGLIAVRYFTVTALVFLALSVIVFFLGQRRGALLALVPFAAFGFGTAQYFVLSFKGVPVMPTDLLALETATAIAGGYDYLLTSKMVIGLCVVGFCVCGLSFVAPGKASSRNVLIGNIVANAVIGVAFVLGCTHVFNTINLDQVIDVRYDRWMPINTFRTLGFTPSFIEIAQDLAIEVPEGYDAEQTEKLIAELSAEFDADMGSAPERQAAEEQFEELKPAIVVVMNETFTDMSIYNEIREAGYEGPQFYNSLSNTLQRGTLMVSVLGGGTANTEFEFLTGNSSAFIGSGKYPYQLYDLSTSDSLAKQLSEAGYVATAMHPQNPVNWKRSTVYTQLGFDDFLSQEDFEGAPWYHSGVTDAATYDKILELLEQDDSPQFIFDVTMQNHGGYAEGTVPYEDMVNLSIPGVEDEGQLANLGVYLACIEHSDSDLEYFIQKLEELERPVVLVFFGDHQPNVSTALEYALNVNADPFEKQITKYKSTHLVWTNYEVAGASLDTTRETSSSDLAAEVFYKIGAPLTDRQKADMMLSQSVSAMNSFGYRGADGLRYELDGDSPYNETLIQIQSIQYLKFGSKVQ